MTVFIAFDTDPTTDPATWVWVDVSSYAIESPASPVKPSREKQS